MACCGIAPGCGRYGCYLCDVVGKLPQPVAKPPAEAKTKRKPKR